MEYNGRNGIEVFKLKHERLSPMEKLIKKLEHYRLENKITQETLANELGVAFSTIGLKAWTNLLLCTSGSSYAAVCVGSRPSSEATKACDCGEFMKPTNASDAAWFWVPAEIT